MPATVAMRAEGRLAGAPDARAGQSRAIPTSEAFRAAAERLNTIGDPIRLQILWWLGRGEWSVTELCGLTGMRQQAVSHHLNIMRLRRIASPRRQGRFRLYGLTDAGRESLAASASLIQ